MISCGFCLSLQSCGVEVTLLYWPPPNPMLTLTPGCGPYAGRCGFCPSFPVCSPGGTLSSWPSAPSGWLCLAVLLTGLCPTPVALRPGPTAELPPDSAPTVLAHGLCLGLSGGIGLSAVLL
eukprot:4537599-Karenia_brevis.AAC.1